MRSVRRVELYLSEDVFTRIGTVEEQLVLHNFSVEQTFEIVLELMKALSLILTADEMKDRAAVLVKALHELQSSRGTERVGRDHLKIHEAI